MGIYQKMSKDLNASVTSSTITNTITGMRKSVVHPSLKVVEKQNSQNIEVLTCKEHNMIKDNFAMQDFDKHKCGDAFCIICAQNMSEEYADKGKKFPVKSFQIIIKKMKSKILEIKSKNTNDLTKNISAMTPECLTSLRLVNDKINPIPFDINHFVSEIQEGVFNRIKGDNETLGKFRETKDFIDAMELKENGDPILQNIGGNDKIKKEYCALAQFLLKWEGIGEIKGDYNGIVDNFKECIMHLNESRKSAVQKMDSLMKALLGPMYEYIFSLENMNADEAFRRKFLPEYINEDYVNRLKAQFQVEISTKDDRISELELQLKKCKSQIVSLNSLNADMKTENERLSNDMVSMKVEFEKKIRGALQQLKNESDKKIAEITDQMIEWKNKYTDLDLTSRQQISKLTLEIKNLNISYKAQITENEVEIQTLRDQLALMTEERDNQIKKNKAINFELSEWKSKHNEFVNEHHEIVDGHENDKKKLNADYKGKISVLD